MRFQFLALIFFFSLLGVAKDAPGPIVVSHSDIKGPRLNAMHTEDLKIFPDGRVTYKEEGNDRKAGNFVVRLTPQKLHKLTKLLENPEVRALPAEIPSKIRTIDYNWENKVELHRNGSQQTVVVHNFYPLLNSHRPAYSKALIELECTLQDIQRQATKRPAPTGDENWCPEAQESTR